MDELKKKRFNGNDYYKAYIDENTNAVYIVPKPINFEEAKIRMNSGLNVYTILGPRAFDLAKSAGGAVIGPKNHADTSKKPGIYYSHYHPWHRKCHIFYGTPTIVP